MSLPRWYVAIHSQFTSEGDLELQALSPTHNSGPSLTNERYIGRHLVAQIAYKSGQLSTYDVLECVFPAFKFVTYSDNEQDTRVDSFFF